MRKFCFVGSPITAVRKRAKAVIGVPKVCRQQGMSAATLYKWQAKFSGLETSLVARMIALEGGNRRLPKMSIEEQITAEWMAKACAKQW